MLKIIFTIFSIYFLYPCMNGTKTELLKPSASYLWYHSMSAMAILMIVFIPMMYSPMLSKMSLSKMFFLDGLSSPLILLTFWISFLMLMASSKVKDFSKDFEWFMTMVVTLMLVLVLVFSFSNFLFFYVFFEMSLVPTFVLIMMWGYQPERLQASMYMLLYTISASLPLLISIIMIFYGFKTLSMYNTMWMLPSCFSSFYHIWWIMTLMAFLVKIPMYTIHLWLPKAHVEAPVAGSMILAGVLLKLGGYGLVRFSIIFYTVNSYWISFISALSLWGMFMTGMICIRQTDMKSLIAYSSVGHMGLMVVGAMSNSTWGLCGSIILMVSHGLCSSGMFAAANIMYEYTSTRSMILQKGLMMIIPSFSLLFFLLCAANMAAPPFINLASEIMLMTSIISISFITAFFLGISTFLVAAYSLYLYTSSHHGNFPPFLNFYPSVKSINFSLLFFHILPLLLIVMNLSLLCEI